ncbi:MAG: magnesium/cobalt transporter CorA [Acidobacteria bacterium]|nr:magnesium/cobalt transporter CorA [Acidobacteriota bacterium]MCI0720759.1 magnesium/cobalt transporter CorA [Acidobacteriota bacterium]
MIQTLVLDRESRAFSRVGDAEEISDLCANSANIVWVDVADPTSQDFEDLAKEFGFHPLSIEDCRHRHQRPKVEEYPGYYFIVLYEAELDEENQLKLRELGIFLGKHYVVTVHSEPVAAIVTAERLWRSWTDLAERGTGLLAYLLMDSIVDDYLPLLDAISDRMEFLEDRIFVDFQAEAIEEIFYLKKELLLMRRSVTPLRDVFNTLLRREQPIFPRETHIYFQDVFDHLIRVADTIDILRDMVSSTMDAYLSISGNRMNMIMKRLTSISTILMSATLVAGIYGMNFEYMPELKWRYGYVGTLASMLAIGLAVYFYFRKIKWL